jgi:hypothetical protein
MTTTHRITTTAAVILSLAAGGAPIASARPLEDPAIALNQAPTTAYSRPDKSMIRVTTPYGGGVAQTASAPHAVVRIQPPAGGFDWGDAGIGAAGGLGLAMLGLGGALAISQRRPHRNRQTTPIS